MSFLTTLPRANYAADAFGRFDGKGNAFDLGAAHALAWACQLAYETADPAKVKSIAAAWGLNVPANGIVSEEIVTPLPKASTQAIVCDRSDAIIIMFAGTDPLVIADWICDFDIGYTAPGIANGFLVAAKSAEQKINAALAGLAANKPIFITGHSLGGALAVITAGHIQASWPGRVHAVYTFGMPRTGNPDFAARYNRALGSRTFRLVHGLDVVPTVAPSSLNFRHVGRLLTCARRGKFDAKSLAPLDGPTANEPEFTKGIAAQLRELLHGPTSGVMPVSGRLKILSALMLGVPTAGVRTDPGGLIIELLPPPLRDHMPDRYIQATS